MKVWIKYLIGIAFGLAASFILPMENAKCAEIIAFLTELFIRVGRYLVVPLIFSTAIVSIHKLRTSKLLGKTFIWTVILIVLSSLLLTLLGLLSILIIKLPRIPITVDVASNIDKLDVKAMLLSLFPYSGFEAVKEGSFLLVSFVFAFLIGWESASDESAFKPVFSLADSCSKLFYNIAVFFTELMSVMLVAIMCYWTFEFRNILSSGIFTPMILMFTVDFVIVVGIIYPLILKYLCHDPHPYKVLYASISPILLALISGDTNLIFPLSVRHAKESLGIRRRCGGFTFPMFSIFARGGSALVSVIAFIFIWRSYSKLSIPFTDILLISGFSFILSFLLGGLPSGGAFVLLTILCSKYGKGFETSYVLLKPAASIICSFSVIFDVATSMFGSYIVAVKTKMVEHHIIQHFI